MDDEYDLEGMMEDQGSAGDQKQADQKGGQTGGANPAQIQKFLGGMDYPAGKQEVVQYAREHGADEKVISTLSALPDQSFETPADLNQALGRVG